MKNALNKFYYECYSFKDIFIVFFLFYIHVFLMMCFRLSIGLVSNQKLGPFWLTKTPLFANIFLFLKKKMGTIRRNAQKESLKFKNTRKYEHKCILCKV